jgi:hypothetical protein
MLHHVQCNTEKKKKRKRMMRRSVIVIITLISIILFGNGLCSVVVEDVVVIILHFANTGCPLRSCSTRSNDDKPELNDDDKEGYFLPVVL